MGSRRKRSELAAAFAKKPQQGPGRVARTPTSAAAKLQAVDVISLDR